MIRLPSGTIYLIDSDPSVYQSLNAVRDIFHLPVSWFETAEQFLESVRHPPDGCILADVELAGMSGVELQVELQEREWEIPAVMMSRRATVAMAIEVMDLGAVTLLEKPIAFNDYTQAIRKALRRAAEQKARTSHRDFARERLGRLTPKEREVFDLIVSGKTNKEMASQLQLSVRAIEDRRARLKRKLGIASPAELGRLARDAQS